MKKMSGGKELGRSWRECYKDNIKRLENKPHGEQVYVIQLRKTKAEWG